MTAARIAKAVAFLAAVEGIFWLFGVISINAGNPYRLYYSAKLAAQIEANLPNERTAPPTGWGSTTERDHPPLATRKCGSAWGGSFTYGDDVPDTAAWPYLASVKIGCEIANIGTDGFGFDQTLLMFQEHAPKHSVVILGMAQPMIMSGAASSWTFLDLDNRLPRARITKPFYTLDDGRLRLHPRPAPEVSAIMRHYLSDSYGHRWTPLRFPFSFSALLAIYRKFTQLDLQSFGPMTGLPDFKYFRDVASATIAEMAAVASHNDDKFAVLLIPRPDDADDQDYIAMLKALASAAPSACLIDPSKEIRIATAALPDPAHIVSKTLHFTAAGNTALADALVRGLADCGIKP